MDSDRSWSCNIPQDGVTQFQMLVWKAVFDSTRTINLESPFCLVSRLLKFRSVLVSFLNESDERDSCPNENNGVL